MAVVPLVHDVRARDPRRFDEGYKRSRNLVRLLRKDDAIGSLLEACNSIGEAYLFGGAVRDTMFGNHSFGDLDIFVSGPLDEELISRLSRYSRRTNFGGMRLVVGKFDVDIWELPKSHAFRIDRGRSVNIESLLASVCFATDAVAISLLSGKIRFDSRFKQALEAQVLSFVQRPLEVELLQTVRIARMVVKLDIALAPDVTSYFLQGVERFGAEGLLAAESKWKGRRILDELILKSLISWCRTGEGNGSPFQSRTLV